MIVSQKTEKEYRALPQISSSDLRKFVTDRKGFYKDKILGQKEEEEYNRSSLIGSLVHCLLLEPITFDTRYHLAGDLNIPTANMMKFTESLLKNSQRDDINFHEACEIAYKDSEYKYTLDKVLDKFKPFEEYYYNILECKTKNLTLVSIADITISENIVKTIKNHNFTSEYFIDEKNHINEYKAESFDLFGLDTKGMIDKIIFDDKNKTIQFVDLKIVYDNQNFFNEYYIKKHGYVQALTYQTALNDFDSKGYTKLPPKFLVADSSNFYAPLIYQLTEEDLDKAKNGFWFRDKYYKGVEQIVNEIKYCLNTGVWDSSLEDINNKGIRQFNYNG